MSDLLSKKEFDNAMDYLDSINVSGDEPTPEQVLLKKVCPYIASLRNTIARIEEIVKAHTINNTPSGKNTAMKILITIEHMERPKKQVKPKFEEKPDE